jgi:dynein heavy chain, axonemal
MDSSPIPQQITGSFRVIAVIEPDIEIILRGKCMQYGVKGANILSNRLKNLYDICHSNLLSLQSRQQITINSFLSIIKNLFCRNTFDTQNSYYESRPGTRTQSSGTNNANSASQSKSNLVRNELYNTNSQNLKDLVRKGRISLLNHSKNDHNLIAQAIIDIITPRLDTNDAKIFKKTVQDIFIIKDDSKSANKVSLTSHLERNIIRIANDAGLLPNKNWIDKCMQIYKVSNTFNSIILCGRSCTGKSSTLETLVKALSTTDINSTIVKDLTQSSIFKKESNLKNQHKIKKIFQSATDNEEFLFGMLSQNGDFKDGLITYMLRKACRSQSTNWLCLDGDILPCWSDNFNSIFDSSLFMQLKNNDHLNNKCKLIFETGDISNAAPSIIAKAGIVWFEDGLVGWRSIACSWLEHRTKNESLCLQKCFTKTLDDVSNFCLVESKPILSVNEESLFISCLNLLGAMLNEGSTLNEIHIERLFLFSLIWTFGGVLEQNDQRGFSDLLYRLVTALPDDDLKSSVYEYYVDESGEWDLWTQRFVSSVLSL